MEVKVYRQDGSEAGRTIALDPSVFDIEPSDHAIWLDVRSIQAAGRQGTHKAKERNEVAGSTRKLYRQKGTGSARAGSAKSPLRRSGGTIFGPRPRNYRVGVNRKTKQLARRSALTYKAREEAVRVLENFSLDAPSTKQVAGLLEALDLAGHKVLVLTGAAQENLYKSGRNLRKVTVCEASSVSTLDLLAAQTILLQEEALEVLTSLLGRGEDGEARAEAAAAPAKAKPKAKAKAKTKAKAKAKAPAAEEAEAEEEASAEASAEAATEAEPKAAATEEAAAEAEPEAAKAGAGDDDEAERPEA